MRTTLQYMTRDYGSEIKAPPIAGERLNAVLHEPTWHKGQETNGISGIFAGRRTVTGHLYVAVSISDDHPNDKAQRRHHPTNNVEK